MWFWNTLMTNTKKITPALYFYNADVCRLFQSLKMKFSRFHRENKSANAFRCDHLRKDDLAKVNKKIEIFTKIFASFLFTISTTPPTIYTIWRTNDEVEK